MDRSAPEPVSDRSDVSDAVASDNNFPSDAASGVSDVSDRRCTRGPTGPTRWLACRTQKGEPSQRGPTRPTGPTEFRRKAVDIRAALAAAFESRAAPDLADLLDAAEERAAIMEFDGGLSRAEADRLALAAHGPAALDAAARNPWRPAPGRAPVDHLGAAATGEGG